MYLDIEYNFVERSGEDYGCIFFNFEIFKLSFISFVGPLGAFGQIKTNYYSYRAHRVCVGKLRFSAFQRTSYNLCSFISSPFKSRFAAASGLRPHEFYYYSYRAYRVCVGKLRVSAFQRIPYNPCSFILKASFQILKIGVKLSV